MRQAFIARTDHREKAAAYYEQNFNCAQSIFATYAVEHGIEETLALRLGTNFGGGARKGELCGAVSGALMVLGLLYGHSERGDAAAKARAYALSEEYMNRFIRENGSVVCRELLGYDLSVPEQMASIREKDLFHVRCLEIIRSAAAILDKLLTEQSNGENGNE